MGGKIIYEFFHILGLGMAAVKPRFEIIVLVTLYALLYWSTFTLHIINLLDQLL